MKLIILDRDGVINFDSEEYIKSPDEWNPIPGSLEAIADLKRAGFTIAVATNQSGIARGLYDLKTLDAIHAKMQDTLSTLGGSIDAIFFCPHHPDEGCDCRKPNPGLLHQIAQHFSVNLNKIPFIGDSLRDLQAAQQAGCQPILVRTGPLRGVLNDDEFENLNIFEDLKAAADHFCKV